jgi:hypothetical protein
VNLIEQAKRLLGLASVPEQLPEYESLEAWATAIGLPDDWTKHPDSAQRDRWWQQYGEVKQQMWKRHLATLSDEEQKQFEDGSHPSLSHDRADLARPFCAMLKADLARRGLEAVVKIGFYHMDRIVLSAYFAERPPEGFPGSPWLFRGFEVKAVQASKPLQDYQ